MFSQFLLRLEPARTQAKRAKIWQPWRWYIHSLHRGLLTKQVSPLPGLAYLCNHGDAKPVFLPSLLREVGDASSYLHGVETVAYVLCMLEGCKFDSRCLFFGVNQANTGKKKYVKYVQTFRLCNPYQLTYEPNNVFDRTGLRRLASYYDLHICVWDVTPCSLVYCWRVSQQQDTPGIPIQSVFLGAFAKLRKATLVMSVLSFARNNSTYN